MGIFEQDKDREKRETDAFYKEYEALCKKYKRVLVPQIKLDIFKLNPEQQKEQEIIQPK